MVKQIQTLSLLDPDVLPRPQTRGGGCSHQEGGSLKQKDFVCLYDLRKVSQVGFQLLDVRDELIHFVNEAEDFGVGRVLQDGLQTRLVVVHVFLQLAALNIEYINKNLYISKNVVPLAAICLGATRPSAQLCPISRSLEIREVFQANTSRIFGVSVSGTELTSLVMLLFSVSSSRIDATL
ncbi:hypothetical protein EYF80_010450 [Liparis tanakae]|uniref:Uncharacterized protein n=1 Tax=Liparis tanakae TaxID=230148 RepID=A0A4Z2IMU6_9TELE|nr:hypothetical protein EYF80_010450 [Liparis tanakae]